jgi:outer membrane biosynthesis protein TonB
MADWRNGKPLARKGIMLQTFRPRFNALNIIDGVRVNPIVELVVGRDGIPQHVVIARSSGNPGVNDAIRSSLYKWRASGKKISELAPGQTVTIRIKLILLAD